MRYYAVIDTNVLVSAMLKWQSVPGSIIEFAINNEQNAYLVTGNIKHFPDEPFIVTPRKMLDIILSDLNPDDDKDATTI